MTNNEYLKSIDAIANNHIARVTVQIWIFENVYNKKRKEYLNTPKPYGTGILVSYMGLKFIFTAKHVTEDRSDEEPLYIRNAEDEFVSIIGNVGMIDSADSSEIDLAYIELDISLVNELELIQNKGFLNAEHIGHGGSIEENEPIVAMGFPELKTKVDKYDLSITTVGLICLLRGAASKVYKYYEKDDSISYGLNYHGVQTGILTGEKSKKVDPEGISGGGVWKIWIEPFMGEELVHYHLIGILSKYKKSKYHVLWANRIELLMDVINKSYGFPLLVDPT